MHALSAIQLHLTGTERSSASPSSTSSCWSSLSSWSSSSSSSTCTILNVHGALSTVVFVVVNAIVVVVVVRLAVVRSSSSHAYAARIRNESHQNIGIPQSNQCDCSTSSQTQRARPPCLTCSTPSLLSVRLHSLQPQRFRCHGSPVLQGILGLHRRGLPWSARGCAPLCSAQTPCLRCFAISLSRAA